MPANALFITSNIDLKRVVFDFFAHTYMHFMSVESQEKAEQWLTTHNTTLILIDQDILKENSISWMNKIRQQHPELQAILLANTADKKESKEWVHSGIGPVFNKPINLFALIKFIQEHYENHPSTPKAPVRSISQQGLHAQLKTYQIDYERALSEFGFSNQHSGA
jgi:DNA-binding NtrC family response regulator